MMAARVDWPFMCWSKRELQGWCTRQWLSAAELYVAMAISPEKLVAEMGQGQG